MRAFIVDPSESADGSETLYGIDEVSAMALSVNSRYKELISTYYKGLLASKSSNRSCLEVRR